MTERRLGPRASVISFVATTVFATGAAMGLFILLDPRAQAFWAARISEFLGTVRGLLPGL